MAIVDFHLHFFSRAFFEALAAQSPLSGSVDEKLARVAAQAKLELPSPRVQEHVERWLAELDRHEVERAAAFASVPEEIPALAQAGALSRGRLTPFALVNPKVAGVAEKVRGLLAEHGFRGVLLFPALHHFDIAGPEVEPLWKVLAEQRAIAYVHCGLLVVKLRDLLGLPRTQDLSFANPLSLVPAANAHPGVRFVVPHFGAGLFREALLAGTQCPNIYLDSSSSNSWMRAQTTRLTLREVFDRALDAVGPGRILFGTDSNTFPAGWRRDRLDEQRAALSALGTAAGDQDKILADNARALLQPV